MDMMINTLAQAAAEADTASMAVGSVWDFVIKGGWMMIPIGVCSLVVLAVSVERAITLRKQDVIPDDFERGLRTKREAEAYCERSDTPISRIVLAGVERIGRPMETIEKHMTSTGEHEIFRLRRRLRALSVVAELLAEGIYEAMITTAAGLVVAIPALVLHHWFAAKIENLTRLMDAVCISVVEAISGATGQSEYEDVEDAHSESARDTYPVRGGAIG